MKYLLITICLLSISTSTPLGSDSMSFGFSETMSLYGMFNLIYDLDKDFFITAGSFVIPFMGGAGLGWKHNFNSSRIKPFISTAGFGVYMFPIMCGTDNCRTKYDFILSGSSGLDIYLFKIIKTKVHLTLGCMTLYSIGSAPSESPSNIPSLWPFINIKLGK